MTLYAIKPRFQALLRPWVRTLAARGVRANHVTLLALLLSLLVGLILWCYVATPQIFLLLPLWMLLRMALNAMDGMLAREFGQQSSLGAYLNELSDVVADAALLLPFALVAPFSVASVAAVIWLATVSEMAGVIGPMVGAPRTYDGPMGKSDRALVFGVLGLWLGLAGSLPAWLGWLLPVLALLLVWNTVRRIAHGVRAARAHAPLEKVNP